MKKIRAASITLLCAASLLSGCVGVSMHSTYPTRIEVTNTDSASPAPNVHVAVSYDYDSYGWFYFFNTPAAETAITDSSGVANINLADFRYRILFKIDGKLMTLTKMLVRQGGVISAPPYKVKLEPRLRSPTTP